MGVFDDQVAHAFGALTKIGQAHVDVGFALGNSDGLVAAGRIAAGAAVELVFLARFAHGDENFADLAFIRLRRMIGQIVERAIQADFGSFGQWRGMHRFLQDMVDDGLA